ncbi:hypothetical protein [Paractinoplanes hotanensis]|uniref:Uncharacterized protein n=1 Tax=Paractinoplanes hotanensis TaxID=2906497 RepID=A0ABT0XSY6_9ACTN|nr:hypothetical protein [Actinoplanes hotanensis]MCM4076883.1 hypothetical protein [Actinoplanes hotanensis]
MNDDEYGPRLLSPLREEPAGPPAIDVVRAMREGRRMRRRRWWTGGSALAALLAAGLTGGLLVADRGTPRPDPVLPAACAPGALPIGLHENVEVTGGDPTGAWIVGYSREPRGSGIPSSILVWHNGALVTDVKPPALKKGSGGVWMNDVNSSGVAVGGNFDGDPEPYVIEGGRIRKLAGGIGDADAINEAGVIAGKVVARGEPPTSERPARWASPGAEPVLLPLPDDLNKIATKVVDVAGDGTVIGGINMKAYLWRPDGSHGYLKLPAIEGERVNGFTPMALRQGWLYGALFTSPPGATSPPRPGIGKAAVHRYELRTGAWQKVADDLRQAQVAGDNAERFVQDEPKTYDGLSILDLPPYVTPAPAPDASPGGTSVEVLSDDAGVASGTTVGFEADGSMTAVPVIWRCR